MEWVEEPPAHDPGGRANALQRWANELATQHAIATPVWIREDRTTALIQPSDDEPATIILNIVLLKKLSDEGLRFLIAHELGHVKDGPEPLGISHEQHRQREYSADEFAGLAIGIPQAIEGLRHLNACDAAYGEPWKEHPAYPTLAERISRLEKLG